VNPLPPDFDLAPLAGQELGQVCLDQYQIQLHFDSSHIQGSGKVSLELDGTTTELFHGTWRTSLGLDQLVGTKVVSWSRRSAHIFSLHFDSGAALVFESEVGPYEDFTVSIGNGAFWIL